MQVGTELFPGLPFGAIGYHFGWQGKFWERFGEFEVCQEADGDSLTD